jgi:carbamoyl-phosphate synthase large subunit
VLVRPSYVLGGRGMQIVHDDDHLARAMAELTGMGTLGREGGLSAERPVLIDRFLEDAVGGRRRRDPRRDGRGADRRRDGARRGGGRSTAGLRVRDPAADAAAWVVEVIESYTRSIAAALEVRGLINVQYAVTGTTVHVIEANPRASRTGARSSRRRPASRSRRSRRG